MANKLLIKGGRVYDHDGDIHKPEIVDILIEDELIAAMGKNLTPEPGFASFAGQYPGSIRHPAPRPTREHRCKQGTILI